MKIRLKTVAGLLFFILVSCSEEQPVNKTYPNYSQLAVGNYWVYEKYAIDSLGNELNLNSLDSVYIEKDTFINGNTYYKMIEPVYSHPVPPYYHVPQKVTYLRDSLDCIVSSKHAIVFSSEQFGNILLTQYRGIADTHYVSTSMMIDPDVNITVAAGTFNTCTYLTTITPYPNWEQIIGGTLLFRTRYAENVGIVTKNLPVFYGEPSRLERRLLRFHVN